MCVCIHIHVFIYSFTLNNTAGLLVSKTVSPLVYYHVQMVLLQNIFRCPLHISLPSWAYYRISSEEEIFCHRPVWWLYSDSEHWWRIPREGAKSTKPRGWRKYTAPTCIATSFLTKLIKDSRSCRLRDLFFVCSFKFRNLCPKKNILFTCCPTLDDPSQMPSTNSPDSPSTDQWLARWCAEPKQSIQVACSEVGQRQVVQSNLLLKQIVNRTVHSK